MVRAPTPCAYRGGKPHITTEYRRAAATNAARGLMTAAVTKLTAVFYALFRVAAKRGRKGELYGIFQQRSRRIADPCYRTGSRTWYLGRD